MSAWTCLDCGFDNAARLATCDQCGVARRYQDDPPLDLPFPPRPAQTAGFVPLAFWSALTIAGMLVLANPTWRESLGISPLFVGLEIAAAAAAALSSFVSVLWQQLFHEVRLEVPGTVRSGEEFEVALSLVPYRIVEKVHVRIELVDQYFRRDQQGRSQRQSMRLENVRLSPDRRLTPRRRHRFVSTFLGPLPVTRRTDVASEMQASVFRLLSPIVPALGHLARNLQEHGGYFVRAHVRVGLVKRVLEKRVVAYHIGSDILVG